MPEPRYSDRILSRRIDAQWQHGPISRRYWCTVCEEETAQITVEAPGGLSLRCGKCNRSTVTEFVWDPTQAPEGREEILTAITQLKTMVFILRRIDAELLYKVLRPYFNAGWTVRDVIWALEQRPDNSGHQGVWDTRDDEKRLLWQVRDRVATWRYTDEEDTAILPGGHTAMRQMMAETARRDKARQLDRHRADFAMYQRAQTDTGWARSEAARVAAIAAIQSRHRRRHAEAEENAQRVVDAQEDAAARRRFLDVLRQYE